METFEYLDFRKEDFNYNCITENGLSESDANDLLELINEYIKRLKEVRNSETLTNVIVKELIKKCESQVWIGNNFESKKYLLLSNWLTNALWQDKSFYWAKLRLGQFHNRKSGIASFDVVNELMSDFELYKLLINEDKEQLPHQQC